LFFFCRSFYAKRRYYPNFKELDKSLIFALERKLDVLDLNERIIEEYRNRLNKLKVRLK